MSQSTQATSQGPFYVRPTVDNSDHLTICQAETDAVIAIIPPRGDRVNWADAAMLAAAPHMVDALIAIREKLMTAKDTINLEVINDIISQTFEKIHAEADF